MCTHAELGKLPGSNVMLDRSGFLRFGYFLLSLSLSNSVFAPLSAARDIVVDASISNSDRTGDRQHFRTIREAIRIAAPGDTIHLQPNQVYRDEAAFYSSHGKPGHPIILDGHGATLDGSDPLRPEDWHEVSPGLFCNHDLMPLTDAMIDRWFFLWDGQMNRMGRVSKATSPSLPPPDSLQPGEWTFVKDEERQVREGYIAGSFYIRLKSGQSLAEANIAAPVRSAGVLIAQDNSNLVIRNLTATHVYNDGYNISGKCRDIALQNIRAIDCGDDGISAHTDSQYTVDRFVSIGNATGICDTGISRTDYRNVFIADCLAHDLFFIQSGQFSITNGVILSSARYAVTLDTLNEKGPCRLALNNVLVVRTSGEGRLSVAKDCELSAEHVTLRNLDMTLSGGKVDWNASVVEGQVPPDAAGEGESQVSRKPKVEMAAAVDWSGDNNRFDVELFRIGVKTFSQPLPDNPDDVGVDRAALLEVPIQEGYQLPP